MRGLVAERPTNPVRASVVGNRDVQVVRRAAIEQPVRRLIACAAEERDVKPVRMRRARPRGRAIDGDGAGDGVGRILRVGATRRL